MCGSRPSRLRHVDRSRMRTVVEHGETDSSVVACSQVVVLLKKRMSILFSSSCKTQELTFRPFICLYRFLQPSPTTQGKGLSFSSASSSVRPSMAMA
jgi:hypothetical protein